MNTLADRLIAAREEKGWRKSDLRRAAGIRSASTLTELESGVSTHSPQIPQIAAALGVTALWLQTGKGPKHHSEAKREIHHSSRPLVDSLCNLAEMINDDGLRELLGFAKCLTSTHPEVKAKAA